MVIRDDRCACTFCVEDVNVTIACKRLPLQNVTSFPRFAIQVLNGLLNYDADILHNLLCRSKLRFIRANRFVERVVFVVPSHSNGALLRRFDLPQRRLARPVRVLKDSDSSEHNVVAVNRITIGMAFNLRIGRFKQYGASFLLLGAIIFGRARSNDIFLLRVNVGRYEIVACIFMSGEPSCLINERFRFNRPFRASRAILVRGVISATFCRSSRRGRPRNCSNYFCFPTFRALVF